MHTPYAGVSCITRFSKRRRRWHTILCFNIAANGRFGKHAPPVQTPAQDWTQDQATSRNLGYMWLNLNEQRLPPHQICEVGLHEEVIAMLSYAATLIGFIDQACASHYCMIMICRNIAWQVVSIFFVGSKSFCCIFTHVRPHGIKVCVTSCCKRKQLTQQKQSTY